MADPCRIQLGRSGRFALIDDDDYIRISRFRWNLKRNKDGSFAAQRTIRIGTSKSTALMHREVMRALPGQWVDHINGDPLDNRRCNLRFCTPRQNSCNVTRSKNQKNGRYKGVHWHKKAKKWEAAIGAGEVQSNGKRRRVYLGLFKDPADAARAYDRAALKAFGVFASLNFPVAVEQLSATNSSQSEVA